MTPLERWERWERLLLVTPLARWERKVRLAPLARWEEKKRRRKKKRSFAATVCPGNKMGGSSGSSWLGGRSA